MGSCSEMNIFLINKPLHRVQGYGTLCTKHSNHTVHKQSRNKYIQYMVISKGSLHNITLEILSSLEKIVPYIYVISPD